MNLEEKIEELYQKAIKDFNIYITLKYISELSKIEESSKKITDDLIDDYLRKRGYTMNYLLGRRIMIRDFTCVDFNKDVIEIWHDKTNSEHLFIKFSLITSLPIALDYMEKI